MLASSCTNEEKWTCQQRHFEEKCIIFGRKKCKSEPNAHPFNAQQLLSTSTLSLTTASDPIRLRIYTLSTTHIFAQHYAYIRSGIHIYTCANELAKKVVAEKEEANAEVEAAKTEVADFWKEHDYLTSANRTKAERSNRLDLDIRTKTNRSQALDDAIDAKKQEVAGLSAKADEKLRDFYTIKERGNWQDPMFFAHCFL